MKLIQLLLITLCFFLSEGHPDKLVFSIIGIAFAIYGISFQAKNLAFSITSLLTAVILIFTALLNLNTSYHLNHLGAVLFLHWVISNFEELQAYEVSSV